MPAGGKCQQCVAGHVREGTHGIQQESCMCDTHLAVEEHRSYAAPTILIDVSHLFLGYEATARRLATRWMMKMPQRRTNLMATCWLFSRLVPSKMTPKEPSPIFLPTR